MIPVARDVRCRTMACAAAVVLLVGSLAGCGTAPEVLQERSTSETVPPVQSAPRPTATPKPSLLLAPGEGYSVLGDILVDGDVEGSDVADRVNGPVKVFTPETGGFVVDAAELLSAAEVVRQAWTIVGPAGETYLAGLVETRVPASGLDPERWETSLISVGVREDTGELLAEVPIVTATCASAVRPDTLAGSGVDVVAASVSMENDVRCASEEKYTAAWNLRTGAVQWRQDGVTPAGETLDTVLSWDADPADTRCDRVTGRAVADGQVLFVYSGAEHRVDKYRCTVSVPDHDLSAVFESQAQKGWLWTVDIDFDDDDAHSVSYDARTGEPRHVRQPVVAYDATTGAAVAVGWDPTRRVDRGLEVYDVRTGETLFSLDQDRYDDLDAHPLSLVAGVLYLDTSDQRLAIDVSTGDVVADDVDVYPLTVVGDFVYLSDGTLQPLE